MERSASAEIRIDRRRTATIRRALLRWYDANRRDLPWRRDRDPYRVWVAETMLQQTRVGAVVPYYERWLERFPTLRTLADAPGEEVLAAWTGLGFYRRARALHEAAQRVRDAHAGHLPQGHEELRALPGVGAYTAGAIASIAFGRPEPAVDGNARRVLARLFDLEHPRAVVLERIAAVLVPPARPGDFNQALMDFGATVCAPRDPACAGCPLARSCLARARGTVAVRPGRRPRSHAPTYRVGTAVIGCDGRVLLARRPMAGLLGGMWEFPGAIATEGESPARAARRVAGSLLGPKPAPRSRQLTVVDQPYSHRRHLYHAFRFETDPFRKPELRELIRARVPRVRGAVPWTETRWRDAPTLEKLPMGAAQRSIARAFAETLA